MSAPTPGRTSKGWIPRCVGQQCDLVDSWKNRAEEDERQRQFVLRLAVASVAHARYYASNSWRVYFGPPLEVDFLLDTGAAETVLSQELAHDLGMRFGGEPMSFALAGGGSAPFWRAGVCLCVAANWLEVPCLVARFTDPLRGPVNLLGMAGLLKNHLFCLGDDELHLLRRAGP